jgi:hypothetical protein
MRSREAGGSEFLVATARPVIAGSEESLGATAAAAAAPSSSSSSSSSSGQGNPFGFAALLAAFLKPSSQYPRGDPLMAKRLAAVVAGSGSLSAAALLELLATTAAGDRVV